MVATCGLLDRQEKLRLRNMCVHEEKAYQKGYQVLAGVDEAGRGPLAGPVVAAACIIPRGIMIDGVNDSKKLTPLSRNDVYQRICSHPSVQYAIGVISPSEIDRINIYQATMQAMLTAIRELKTEPDYLLVDGLKNPHPTIPGEGIIGGDSGSFLIAAASVIAKEVRDKLMLDYHEQWPEYGFDEHKGYGTPQHLKAIEKYGICAIHRRSFGPCKKLETSARC